LEVRDTKLGNEELTNDIPNVSEEATKDLDENGMIELEPRLNLVTFLSKNYPKGESDPTPKRNCFVQSLGIKQVM
jgi:DNA-directed RNA polymerase subunit beta